MKFVTASEVKNFFYKNGKNIARVNERLNFPDKNWLSLGVNCKSVEIDGELGGRYFGEVDSSNRRHGKGIFRRFIDGNVYIDSWRSGD